MDKMIGKSLGKYQIIEPLGEGGMATVYKAYDPSLERYVAIKIIRTSGEVDPNFLIRFQREARALAKMDHPYILKVLDFGEENGMPYLVMPYVAHGTLKQYTRTRMPYDKAIGIILPVADALSYAHKRKIIHRDIKPANILFGESGEPILSDFGIAKILDAEEQIQLTGTGLGIGTPAYMAPEQWNGIADERTDIYALGIVLYELITGCTPYQADTPAAILLKQVQDPLPRPRIFVPDLPDDVEAIIFKALAKDPTVRFQTMQDFIRAMNAVLQGKTVNFILPPVVPDQNAVTQVSARPTTIGATPFSGSQIPQQIGSEQKPNRKLLPWMIGGGVILIVACISIILVFGFLKADPLKLKKPTITVNNVAQVQITLTTPNVGQSSQTTPQSQPQTQTQSQNQPEPTSTSEPLPTKTLASVTTIENMPADIPVFTPNNGDVTTTTQEGTLMFSYSTFEEASIVETFFVDKMKNDNWEVVSTSQMTAQNAVMYAYSKDTRTAMVYVMGNQNDRTFIQIIVANE